MAMLAHLTPETRALAQHDDARRIAYLAEDRWIDYPRAREALQELERLLRSPERTRMPGLLIHGESNIGKSMIIQKFLRTHSNGEFNVMTGLLQVDILAVEMPPAPQERRLYGQLLMALNAPYRPGDRLASVEQTALALLHKIGPRMIVVDEVHNLLAGSAREQRAALNRLKFLSNQLRCAVVVVGTRDAGRPLTWQRSWMHVSTAVCEQHRSWLTPVTLGEMRNVRNERGLTELAQRVFDREKTPIAEIDGLIDSAVWLQRLMQEPQSFDPPWGAVRADVRQQMVNVVARMLVSENMRELVGSHGSDATHGGWSDDGGNWDMQTFSMEGHLGNAALLTLPRQLSTRQLLCGLIGNFLRYSPAERVMKSVRPSQLKLMIDKLPSSMGAWPLPAIAWISPKAAEFVRASRALRERHKISPAYFRAYAAMRQEFLASDSNM